jgi:hypothetical protein
MSAVERRARILDAAEVMPATTWLEAAEKLLDQQAARARELLEGTFTDRSEGRKHLIAIEKLRKVLRSNKALSKGKVAYLASDDPLIRKMRRADLLCPKGWREGIRQELVQTADSSEKSFLETADDQEIIDAIEIRAFVSELDFVYTRGDGARHEYARRSAKVA